MDLLHQNEPVDSVDSGRREELLSAAYRYGGAAVAVAAGTAVRYWLHPALGGGGFGIYFIVVVAVAWFGGLGPCLASQFASLAISIAFFSNPDEQPSHWGSLVAGLGAFFFAGIAAALLSQGMRAAEHRARARAAEADAERQRLWATLSCMGEGVIATDESGRILLVNPVAERLTGWIAGEAQGRPLDDVFALCEESTGAPLENLMARVVGGQRIASREAALVLASRVGGAVPIGVTAAPIQDDAGRTRGMVLVFRDETERRRVEKSLREADRRKDEFLATLAHELRNPMAPIRTGLEVMKLANGNPELIHEVRSTMERQTEHVIRLIDDLLDVSRITRGKLQLRMQRTDLAQVMQDAVETARPMIDAAGHRLNVSLPEKPLILSADPHRLSQVVANLLTNAAKFTPPGGAIELAAQEQHGEAVISVKDNGIGVPAALHERIFEMFSQVDRSNERGDTGLGIGLTLVRSLVEMHGGNVSVRSSQEEPGSEFIIRFPVIAPPQESAPASPGQPAARSAKRRILAVDDNPAALSTLSLLLEIMGEEVRTAQDGVEAIAAAESFRPHVVFMDLGMPRMDGLEAARRIRQEPWGREMLLVAVTGWGRDEDRRQTKEVGFDHHLVKPVEPAALSQLLAERTNACRA